MFERKARDETVNEKAGMNLGTVLALQTPEKAGGSGPFAAEWPDGEEVRSPRTLGLAAGDAPGEWWYVAVEDGRRLRRACRGSGGGGRAEGGVELFPSDSRPRLSELARARERGYTCAELWLPVAEGGGSGGGCDHLRESRCLNLLRQAGFGRIRLAVLVPDGAPEESLRGVLGFLLADREALEIHTYRLAEAGVEPGAGPTEEASARLRFYAALFAMTRSEKLGGDTFEVLAEDAFLRTHLEELADLACNLFTPSERLKKLRRRVGELTGQLAPAGAPSPAGAPWPAGARSLAGRLKARARENLPGPVWEALRRARRSVLPRKEG